MSWYDAVDHCDDLDTGGFDDWRLPDIDELISLLRGCVDGEATADLSESECTMTPEGCSSTDICDGVTDCDSCLYLEGPGDGRCYWDPALGGACLRYWSSSSRAANTSYAWYVSFFRGYVSNFDKALDYSARCVRSGP